MLPLKKKGPPRNPFLKSRQAVVRLTEVDKEALSQYCVEKDVSESAAVRGFIRSVLRKMFPATYANQ